MKLQIKKRKKQTMFRLMRTMRQNVLVLFLFSGFWLLIDRTELLVKNFPESFDPHMSAV